MFALIYSSSSKDSPLPFSSATSMVAEVFKNKHEMNVEHSDVINEH